MSKRKILLAVILGLLAIVLLRNEIFLLVLSWVNRPKMEQQQLPLPALKPELRRELASYLRTHFQSPEDYILSKFQDHDIVFLGEYHRIRHDPLLVQRMIPLLYRHGVYTLGMEFACRRDQPKIDSLITADRYDPSLASRILFDFLYSWGYQEYADIFKAAWRLNRSLPDSARKFRILGLNTYADWRYVQTPEDRKNPAVMARVFAEGSSDSVMAYTILREIADKGGKALIYCGIHHAFTRYHQPMFDEKKRAFAGFIRRRAGNIVYGAVGDRAFTVCLHMPWPSATGYSAPEVYPADGIVDTLMKALGKDFRPVGFDTRGTPFGKLPGNTSIYKMGYPSFSLQDFCDGYIYQKPLSRYEGVTPIQGFINSGNLAEARSQLRSPEAKQSPLWKVFGPPVFNRLLVEHNIRIRQWMSRFK